MRSECPLCAKSRHPALFDCLVGKLLELCGHLEAQRFSSLQIDDQLEFGRLLHSNSAGWAPLRILSTYGAVWRARSARLAPYDSRVDVVAQHRACHRSPDHSWLRHAKVWLRVVPRVALNRAAAQCLLRVKSRHRGNLKECPLYPQKRTLLERLGMSALCQKQTHAPQQKAIIRSPRRPERATSLAALDRAPLRS